MDRYIIINGTPYICHEYDMDSFIEEYKLFSIVTEARLTL